MSSGEGDVEAEQLEKTLTHKVNRNIHYNLLYGIHFGYTSLDLPKGAKWF